MLTLGSPKLSPRLARAAHLLNKGDTDNGMGLILSCIERDEDRLTAYDLAHQYFSLMGRADVARAFLRRKENLDFQKDQKLRIVSLDRSDQLEGPIDQSREGYYCTYFDKNYISKGIVMINSLWNVEPNAKIFVLCMDSFTEHYLKLNASNAIPVGIDRLKDFDLEFALSRSNRSQVEWYFTATACLLNFLIQKLPAEITSLTYLDADLCFFSSLGQLHSEANGSSVQVIEHRFPPALAQLEVHGRFNVGWMKFANDEMGKRVIAEYRRDCLEWCYDRVELTRYADQKYLDYWPELYPNVCISEIHGANVAPWNISNYDFRLSNNVPTIDAEPIIFYHFHGIKRGPGNSYAINRRQYPYPDSHDFKRFYSDYVRKLFTIDEELRSKFGQSFDNLR